MDNKISFAEKIIQFWKINERKIIFYLPSISLVIYIPVGMKLIKNTESANYFPNLVEHLSHVFLVAGGCFIVIIGFISIVIRFWEKDINKRKEQEKLIDRIRELETKLTKLEEYQQFALRVKNLTETKKSVDNKLIGLSDDAYLGIITQMLEELEIEELNHNM